MSYTIIFEHILLSLVAAGVGISWRTAVECWLTISSCSSDFLNVTNQEYLEDLSTHQCYIPQCSKAVPYVLRLSDWEIFVASALNDADSASEYKIDLDVYEKKNPGYTAWLAATTKKTATLALAKKARVTKEKKAAKASKKGSKGRKDAVRADKKKAAVVSAESDDSNDSSEEDDDMVSTHCSLAPSGYLPISSWRPV